MMGLQADEQWRGVIIQSLNDLGTEYFEEDEVDNEGEYVDMYELIDALGLHECGQWVRYGGVERLIRLLEVDE